jgi:mono/diheme cytochrome c family protein
VLRSFPSSVTAAPNGREFLITMEGSDAIIAMRHSAFDHQVDVLLMDATATMPDDDDTLGPADPFVSAQQAGMMEYPVAVVNTAAGPRGVVFTDDEQAWVHSFLDRAVQEIDYDSVHDRLRDSEDGERFDFSSFNARSPYVVADSALPAEVEDGRRLFFSATDPRMSAPGSGVSCSTCHFEGRNDGLTWMLEGVPRQTPSLAGPVQQTAPMTWADDVPSIADEAMLTTSLRMGGGGLTLDTAELVEAYVAWSRYPDAPRAGDDSDLVRLGEEVFNRSEVGCASCHSGDLYTDNASHLIVGDTATQTPTLRGISASAPYLHDGSARDLKAVVVMARDGSMGDTSGLSDREENALVAYLESL